MPETSLAAHAHEVLECSSTHTPGPVWPSIWAWNHRIWLSHALGPLQFVLFRVCSIRFILRWFWMTLLWALDRTWSKLALMFSCFYLGLVDLVPGFPGPEIKGVLLVYTYISSLSIYLFIYLSTSSIFISIYLSVMYLSLSSIHIYLLSNYNIMIYNAHILFKDPNFRFINIVGRLSLC